MLYPAVGLYLFVMSVVIQSETVAKGCFTDAFVVNAACTYRQAYCEALEDPYFSRNCLTLRAISHALANLIMPISEYPRLLQSVLPDTSPGRGIVEKMGEATEELCYLHRELVRLCHGLEGQSVEMDLAALVSEVVHTLLEEVGALLVPSIHIESDADPVYLFAPQEAIYHLIRDLCVRAITATSDQHQLIIRVGTVNLTSAALGAELELTPGPYAALRVTDDGKSLNDEEWAECFCPFARCAVNDHHDLGLSAVYRTVRHLQGTCLYQTRNRQGTDILILFPQTNR